MRTTPLHAWHVAHRGRMVDFAGWSMPVQYSSIVDEHLSVRSSAGLFDVSHMGRLRFEGPQAGPLLESLLTRRVSRLKPGQVRYSLVTNNEGGILDDVLVYRHPTALDTYMLVVNASNREKLLDWIRPRVDAIGDVGLDDQTFDTAMLAVQGPLAVSLLEPLLASLSLFPLSSLSPLPPRSPTLELPEALAASPQTTSESSVGQLANMPYYSAAAMRIAVDAAPVPVKTVAVNPVAVNPVADNPIVASATTEVLVSRTGYTGEDGFELIAPANRAIAIADWLLAAGVRPVGLGARDTLRLEAGMPLYGHELNETTDPFTAGLGFAVDLGGRAFPGSEELDRRSRQKPSHVRIGLMMHGQRVPREGFAVLSDGVVAGVVSSGTFSPTLRKPIAMAYVESRFAVPGGSFAVDIRGHSEPAVAVPLPFYRRTAVAPEPPTILASP
ncbi:MAG: glycine cleavage system aminomethyltransferase GcvT [Planctomycetota bacterium]